MPLEIVGLSALQDEPIPVRGDVVEYPKGVRLGSYFCVGDKPGGVEPGFLGIYIDDNFVERFNKRFPELASADPEICKRRLDHANKNNINVVDPSTGERKKFSDAVAVFAQELKKECQNKNEPTDLKMWLIKQDYNTALFGKVSPPTSRLAKTNAVESIVKKTRLSSTQIIQEGLTTLAAGAFYVGRLLGSSQSQENINAVKESLANDIANLYGMRVQRQQLLIGSYEDGHPKLMTACGWEPGFQPIEGRLHGSKTKEDYEGYITEKDDPTRAARIEGAGEYLPLLYYLGDRDALGSKGGNKGLVEERIVDSEGAEHTVTRLLGIDFGKAYPQKNLLVPTMQDDFSITQPNDVNKKFKNISSMQDYPITEKMMSMFYMYQLADDKAKSVFTPQEKQKIELAIAAYEKAFPEFKSKIEKMRAEDAKEHVVFDAYILKFKELQNKAEKSGDTLTANEYKKYAEEVKQAKAQSVNNSMAMFKVMKERMQLSPQNLGVLDNLEKLTSIATPHSGDTNVQLNHLRVQPEFRTRWRMEVKDGVATFTGTPPETFQRAFTALQVYLSAFKGSLIGEDKKGDFPTLSSLRISDGNPMKLSISEKELPYLAEYLNEDNIREFKFDKGRNIFRVSSTVIAGHVAASTNAEAQPVPVTAGIKQDNDVSERILEVSQTQRKSTASTEALPAAGITQEDETPKPRRP